MTWLCDRCRAVFSQPEVDDDHRCCPHCKSSHIARTTPCRHCDVCTDGGGKLAIRCPSHEDKLLDDYIEEAEQHIDRAEHELLTIVRKEHSVAEDSLDATALESRKAGAYCDVD